MKLTPRHNLPFVTVNLEYRGKSIEVPDVLVDTGSATTIFSVDMLENIDILPAPDDITRTLRGVGEMESLFTRHIDLLR